MQIFTDFFSHAGWLVSLAILGAFLLAGFVKGCIGLGMPTVAVGLLSMAMPAPQAAALLVVPAVITNIWQMSAGGQFVSLTRRLAPLLVGVCVGNAAGVAVFAGVSAVGAANVLGGALICYAALGLSPMVLRVPPRIEGRLGGVCGLLTGMITAVTGVFVLPSVPYLQALQLDRHALVQGMGIAFMVSTLAMAGGLIYDGELGVMQAGASLVALLPAMVGMGIGQALRRRISERAFKHGFFIALALLGISLLFKS